jgi:hypothetical protein
VKGLLTEESKEERQSCEEREEKGEPNEAADCSELLVTN